MAAMTPAWLIQRNSPSSGSVEKVAGALVDVVEVFPAREAEPAQVLQPGVHLVPGDGRQLLPFP